MNKEIKENIARLYSVCSKFSKPLQLNSCDCCHTEAEKRSLLATPLGDLTVDQMTNFIYSAYNTMGDEEDVLYFLPRIIELSMTEGGLSHCDLGLIGDKIYKTHYWERGEDLLTTLDSVLLTHFEHDVLKREMRKSEVSDWMCCIGNATPNIEQFLDLLFEAEALKEFYDSENQHAVKGKLSDSFWTSNHGNREKIISWILSDEVEAKYWKFYE